VRILANENVPEPLVSELRRRGHDVVWMVEAGAGDDDKHVLQRAQQERRLVVTLDKDFGELAFAQRLPAQHGVVLIRTSGSSPDADNARAVIALESRDDWFGRFATIEDDRIRSRPIPGA
jgi:predicted nuclease of predicted toxin-antitoxin system